MSKVSSQTKVSISGGGGMFGGQLPTLGAESKSAKVP